MKYGIITAQKSVEETLQLDTRKARLQIDLTRDPEHLQIINVKATAIVARLATWPAPAEEVLFTMKHNLGYTPKVLVYFFIPSVQAYAVGTYFYQYGTADDIFTYSVTDTSFSIIHRLTDYFGFFDVTSTANTLGDIRVKFLIFSNPVGAVTNDATDT